MKSVRRLLLWSIASLALLLVGILIWSVLFFDPNDYRESIADRIEKQTGFKLTLEGSLGLDFRFRRDAGLFAELAVEDAYLRKIADMQGVQFAHIRELTISLPVMQLLRLVMLQTLLQVFGFVLLLFLLVGFLLLLLLY